MNQLTTGRIAVKPGDRWHGFEGLAENHVLVDPIKVTILTPGLSASGATQDFGIPVVVLTKFLSSRRIEIEKTGLYSFLVLFSMGITKGNGIRRSPSSSISRTFTMLTHRSSVCYRLW